MFEVNDKVMYGQMGACIINSIEEKEVGGQNKLYYVISPVNSMKTTIFCPVDCDKKRLRGIIEKEQALELMESVSELESEWIENDSMRKIVQDETLKSGDHKEIIKLIKLLHLKRKALLGTNRKFHVADQRVMDTAEKLIYSEFAIALDMQEDEVGSFFADKLNNKKIETV